MDLNIDKFGVAAKLRNGKSNTGYYSSYNYNTSSAEGVVFSATTSAEFYYRPDELTLYVPYLKLDSLKVPYTGNVYGFTNVIADANGKLYAVTGITSSGGGSSSGITVIGSNEEILFRDDSATYKYNTDSKFKFNKTTDTLSSANIHVTGSTFEDRALFKDGLTSNEYISITGGTYGPGQAFITNASVFLTDNELGINQAEYSNKYAKISYTDSSVDLINSSGASANNELMLRSKGYTHEGPTISQWHQEGPPNFTFTSKDYIGFPKDTFISGFTNSDQVEFFTPVKMDSGLTLNGNFMLNGISYSAMTSGTSGSSGSSGSSGKNGTSGSSGTNGTSGSSGSSGTSGSDGVIGSSGTSGIDGTTGITYPDLYYDSSGKTLYVEKIILSGTTLVANTSGSSGSSGSSGINGTSGSSGLSGTNGTSGSSGLSGTNGTSGTSGSSGLSGTNGTSGSSGSSGTNGTSGSSGSSGSSGKNGTNGTSGSSGSSGSSGTNGTSGSSGTNGTSGLSGSTFSTLYFDDVNSNLVTTNLTVSKLSGTGIKVDTSNPTFGWKDLTGQLVPGSLASAPALTAFRGIYAKAYAFIAGDKIDNVTFHMPHDYLPNSDMFIHLHWGHNATAFSGTFAYNYYITYCKGYNQSGQTFNSEITVAQSLTGLTITGTTRWSHNITEQQFTSATGSTTTLDRRLLEVDGLIMIGFNVATIPTISGGVTNGVYCFMVDIHYQSNGVLGTKDKNYPFYV